MPLFTNTYGRGSKQRQSYLHTWDMKPRRPGWNEPYPHVQVKEPPKKAEKLTDIDREVGSDSLKLRRDVGVAVFLASFFMIKLVNSGKNPSPNQSES